MSSTHTNPSPLTRDESSRLAARNVAGVSNNLNLQKAVSSPHFRFPTPPDSTANTREPILPAPRRSSDPGTTGSEKNTGGKSGTAGEPGPPVVREAGNLRLRLDSPHRGPSATHLPRSVVEQYLGWSEISADQYGNSSHPQLPEPAGRAADPRHRVDQPPAAGSPASSEGIETAVSHPTARRPATGRFGPAGDPFGTALSAIVVNEPVQLPSAKEAPPFSGDPLLVPGRILHGRQTQTAPAILETPLAGGLEKRLTDRGRTPRPSHKPQVSVVPAPKAPLAKESSRNARANAPKDAAPAGMSSAATDRAPNAAPAPTSLRRTEPSETASRNSGSDTRRTAAAVSAQGRQALLSIPLFPEPAWPLISDLLLGAGWPFLSRMADGMERILSGRTNRIPVAGVDRSVGTTTISLTLARWAAACKRRVLVVDADLQAAGLSRMLGKNPATLWPSSAPGDGFLRNCLIRSSRSGIAFATTSPLVNRQLWPPFVLNRLGELLDSVEGLFDLVLIDAGPVHQVVAELTSMERLSPCALVVSGGQASQEPLIQSACQRLGELGAQRILAARNFSARPMENAAA